MLDKDKKILLLSVYVGDFETPDNAILYYNKVYDSLRSRLDDSIILIGRLTNDKNSKFIESVEKTTVKVSKLINSMCDSYSKFKDGKCSMEELEEQILKLKAISKNKK